MPHTHTYRLIIADGEHARLVNASAVPHFHTVEKFTGHHGESHHDPQAAAKHQFVKRLAARIDTLVAAETFDELFLVAPAPFLTDLRAHLGHAAAAKLKASVQKDLTKVPDGDLPKHFPDWPLVLAA